MITIKMQIRYEILIFGAIGKREFGDKFWKMYLRFKEVKTWNFTRCPRKCPHSRIMTYGVNPHLFQIRKNR
jgi:hypothetical protein